MFLWLACKDKLLTNQTRRSRGFSDSSECQRCEGRAEDVIHVLRDCNKAIEVWIHIIPSFYLQEFFSINTVRGWVLWNINATFKVDEGPWRCWFAIICTISGWQGTIVFLMVWKQSL